MAGGNMGDLSFTLSVKSRLEQQMKTYQDQIDKTDKKVKQLKASLDSARANKETAAIPDLVDDLKKSKQQLKDMKANAKGFETRMQSVLDKAHDFDNLLKTWKNNVPSLKIVDPEALKSGAQSLREFYSVFRKIWEGDQNSPFVTNQGFKSAIGDTKRQFSDTKSVVNAGSKEVQAAYKKAANDEQKAELYYVTRKQRVDDAIQAMYDRRAKLAERIKSAPDIQKAQLQGINTLINQVIARLSNAKDMYEKVQMLQAKGLPAPMIRALTGAGNKSETYLGRYTGMSELFGGDIKKGEVPYNYVTSLYREAMEKTASPFSFRDRIANNKANAQMLVRGGKAVEKAEKDNTASLVAEQKQIDKTVERYRELTQIVRSAMEQIISYRSRGLDYSSLLGKLQPVQAMRHDLRNAIGGEGYSFNLYDSGKARNQVKDLQDLTKQYDDTLRNLIANRDKVTNITSIIDAMQKRWADIQANPDFKNANLPSGFNKQIKDLEDLQTALQKMTSTDLSKAGSVTDLLSRRHFGTIRREVNAVFSDIEKGYKQSETEAQRNANEVQRTVETIKRTYSRLFDQLNGLRNARANANILGINTDELDKAINRVLFKLKSLRDLNPDSKTYNGSNLLGYQKYMLFSDADSKREEELVNRLIAKYQELNSEKRKSNADVLARETSAARDLASAFDHIHNSASKSSQVLSDIKSLFFQGGIVFGAQQFANSIIQTGGDIVQQHIALRSILGDAQKADQLFAQTQQLALQSPFKFQELNRDVKQLAAFGVDTDKLYDTTKRLADVASGLGVSFERLGLAYGQVKSRSWLDGKELRQFAYAGLPMLQKIADLYNEEGKNGRHDYTTSDVRSMITKRLVSFEDVDKVFQKLTDEGGQFYNMQFALSDTLLGKWNKLQDAWTIMLGKFADGSNILGKTFKFVIDAATQLVQLGDSISPALLSFGAAFGGKRILSDVQNRFGVGSIVNDMKKAEQVALSNFSIRQATRVAEGEITLQQAKQNIAAEKNLLASKETANMKYMQLTAEGKLNAFQLGRLAANQKIDVSLVRQLVTTGQISRYQALLVLEAERYSGTMKGLWAQVRLGASSLWSTLKGLFSWANIITFGIGAAMSAVMSHEQKLSEMDSKADSVTGKYKSKAEDISETLTKINNKISKDSVDAMESALSKAGQLTDEVKNQVNEADTLTEKYEILRKKMEETLEMSKNLKNQELIGNVLKASNGDIMESPEDGTGTDIIRHILNASKYFAEHLPFTDKNGYASDNISKLNELENAIKNMASGLATSFDSVDKALKQTTDAAHDSVFYEKVSKLPFEERIKAILRSGYSQKFLDNLYKVDSNASLAAGRLRNMLNSFDEYLQKLIKKNVPNMVNELENQMGLLGTDTKNWSSQQVNTFVLMFQQIMAAAGEMSDYVRSKVWQSFLTYSQLGKNLNPSGIRVVTTTNSKGEKLYDTYLGQEGDDKKGHYVVSGFHKSKTGRWTPVKIYNPAADKPQAPSPTGSNEDSNKNKKKNKGNQKDTELEAVRNRVELYEKFYSEYKKLADYVGEGQALADLKASDDFKAVFGWKLSDVTNYSQSLDQLTKSLKGTNEERKKFLNDTDASKASKTRDDLMQKIKDNVAWANQQLDEFDAKYETYKKIVEATGNEDVANSVAFGRMPGDETSPRTKHDMIKSVLGDFYNMKPEDAETFLGLDRTQAEKQVGKESGQFKLWDANQKDGIKNLKDANDLLVDLMTKHQTIQDQIDAENKKYDHQLKLLELEKGNLSPENYEKQKNSLTETHNQTIGDLQFQKYKQDSGWENIFRDMDRLSVGSIDSMLKSLRQFLVIHDMSEENVKAIVEAMDKLQERKETASPFASIAEGYKNLSLIDQIRAQGLNANGKYNVSPMTAAKLGLTKNKNNEYSKQEIDDVEAGIYKGFGNSIKGVEAAFKALEGAMQPVTELLGTLGNKGISEGLGIADKAVGSMSSTMGNFDTLSKVADGFGLHGVTSALGKAGPYGAAAAAALSIGNSLLNKFGFGAAANKRYEKQEKYYKQMISTMQDINSNLENRVSNSYGSQSIDTARKLVANYGAQASEARETYQDWSQAHTLHRNHRNRMYLFGGKGETQEYLEQINDFLRQNGYTGSQVGGDTIQNLDAKWLKLIKEDMPDAWAHMNEEAQGYLNTIIEMEGDTEKLKEANDKLNEVLTGMSFDGMKSDYESVLDDLDSDNDDLADNLEKKLREAILNSMISNLYKDQIEKAISDTADLAKNEEYVDKNGNIKRHTLRDSKGNLTYGEADIASEYTADEYNKSREEMRGITDDMMQTRNMLKDLYGWYDRNSSSMSSSVKGMSEEEGGLFVSYTNAIRADVSVIRQTNGIYLPKLDITATAQLQQLNMITENTRRNAEAAERIDAAVNNMNDMFTRGFNGTKPLHVDVK